MKAGSILPVARWRKNWETAGLRESIRKTWNDVSKSIRGPLTHGTILRWNIGSDGMMGNIAGSMMYGVRGSEPKAASKGLSDRRLMSPTANDPRKRSSI